MEKTGRIAKWDNVKFILILSVVLGHFLARYTGDSINAKRLEFFIYTYHMPAFVFISGLFAKKTIDQKRYDKIFGFLLLFLVTKYALFLVRVLRRADLGFAYFEMNDVAWYAFAIFVFCLETIFFRRFEKKWMMTIVLLNALMAGYASDIDTFLSLSRLFTFYPFFLLGYYLEPAKIVEFTKKTWVKIASGVILLVTAVLCYVKIDSLYGFIEILKGKHGYATLKQYGEYGFFLRGGWYIAAMVLMLAVIAVIPELHCIFTTIGSRTMQIYALHYVPMLVFFGNLNGKELIQNLSQTHQLPIVILIAFATTCLLAIKPITVVVNWLVSPKSIDF